jgi:hypothetical protein
MVDLPPLPVITSFFLYTVDNNEWNAIYRRINKRMEYITIGHYSRYLHRSGFSETGHNHVIPVRFDASDD